MNSLFLKLGTNDLFKGAVMAVFMAIGTVILPVLQSNELPTFDNLQTAAIAGFTAGLVYLIKNLFTNSKGQTFKAEPK